MRRWMHLTQLIDGFGIAAATGNGVALGDESFEKRAPQPSRHAREDYEFGIPVHNPC